MTKKTIKRQCVECGAGESNSLQIHEIIMPPELPTKTAVCNTCYDDLLDRSRKVREIGEPE